MASRPGSVLRRFRVTRAPLERACEHLAATNERTLAWQCEVTRIAAPTGSEAARGEWMSQTFRMLGWTDVRTDLRGNVIARRPSSAHDATRPAVWCCAHLDTVFSDPAPQVTRDGAALRGPGIGDNGRGLAALLALADALHGEGLATPHEIILACTVGEEGLGDLRGMKQLMDDATPAPHAVVAIDGAGDDRIVTTALGSLRWRIAFAASGGHSWADFGAPNPVHAAAAVAAALQALPLQREPRTTLTVARIGGGETINSIPREGWLEVDMRSLRANVLSDLDRALRETVARVERSENGRRTPGTAPLTSEVTLLGSRPCGALREDSPLVRLAQQATRAVGIHAAAGHREHGCERPDRARDPCDRDRSRLVAAAGRTRRTSGTTIRPACAGWSAHCGS